MAQKCGRNVSLLVEMSHFTEGERQRTLNKVTLGRDGEHSEELPLFNTWGTLVLWSQLLLASFVQASKKQGEDKIQKENANETQLVPPNDKGTAKMYYDFII